MYWVKLKIEWVNLVTGFFVHLGENPVWRDDNEAMERRRTDGAKLWRPHGSYCRIRQLTKNTKKYDKQLSMKGEKRKIKEETHKISNGRKDKRSTKTD